MVLKRDVLKWKGTDTKSVVTEKKGRYESGMVKV